MAKWKVRAALQGFGSWLSIAKCKANPTIYRVFGTATFSTLLSVVFLFCIWKLTTN